MLKFLESYPELKRLYQNLESNISGCLKQELDEKNISIFDVQSRIKDENSIENKIISKGYKDPANDIEDFCGVRVICYYQEDISNICEIIKNNFEIIREENKQNELSDNQFGYTSYHYIIKLKPEWLGHHSAKGLKDLKAEIQIRTMLMHTWSAISHKLLYKKEKDIPPQFKRKLNRLSALIELADEQFDQIKNEKQEYNSSSTSNKKLVFDLSEEINSDNLMALKTYYFNDRDVSENQVSDLLDEIRGCGFNLGKFVEAIDICFDFLPEMEKEEADEVHMELPLWGFSGVVRTVLDLSSDEYFSERLSAIPSDIIEMRDKYRAIYKSKI